MTTPNDFKIIQSKCINMFNSLNLNSKRKLSEIEKARLGFYHLILEHITKAVNDSQNGYIVLDTDYNKILGNVTEDDLGIDAIYIEERDDEENDINIQLFCFKYREKYNDKSRFSKRDVIKCNEFLNYISAGKKLKPDTEINRQINRIIEIQNTSNLCNFEIYFVSNENQGFSSNCDQYINTMEDQFDIEFKSINLKDLVNYFIKTKKLSKSKFIIDSKQVLPFEDDEKSTRKSYIVMLSLLELIRITCTNKNLANDYKIEDDSLIKDCKLNLQLLFDNVRGYLGDTEYNENILSTLKENHSLFFMYNNGVTITSEDIEAVGKNSNKKYLFTLTNFQIVNGGQTLRTLYNFIELYKDEKSIENLRNSSILIRIFKIHNEEELKRNIAKFTNSQNAISDMDLQSVDYIQIQIEQYLSDKGILYVRKAGDTGEEGKQYNYRIQMVKYAQIAFSALGYPEKVTNQKRKLFNKYYEEIFNSKNFDFEKCLENIENYREIVKKYSKLKEYSVTDQKIFYIIYVINNFKASIDQSILSLENTLKEYRKDEDIASARKLIQKAFKKQLDEILNDKYQTII